MQDHRVETTVSSDGSLSIKGLPVKAGEKVEVIMRGRNDTAGAGTRYPLRGKPIEYTDPFGSVAEEDWEAVT